MLTNIYFFQLEHRRLREKYSWAAILRHEKQIMEAMYNRYKRLLP